MVHVQLSDADSRILIEALKLYLVELRREVAGTENPEFRHDLQTKQNALERIVKSLAEPGA